MKFLLKSSFLGTAFYLFCLLTIVLILSLYSSKEIKEVIFQQFNERQIILARQLAGEIKGDFDFFIEQLKTIKKIDQQNHEILSELSQLSFSHLKHFGLKGLFFLDEKGNSFFSLGENKDNINFSLIFPDKEEIKLFWHRPFLYLSTKNEKKFIIFVVDVSFLIKRHFQKINPLSGWVIDEEGYFIYHTIKELIGQNAFKEAKKKSYFYFKEVSDLKDLKIFKGEEGIVQYAHLGDKGKKTNMNILVYTPIFFSDLSPIYSLILCFPEEEITAGIHNLYLREFLTYGSLIFALFWLGLILFSREKDFRKTLEIEIAKKTQSLTESQKRYRLLIKGAQDLILTLDLAGNIASLNQATATFFKKEPRELYGQSFDIIMQWPHKSINTYLNQICLSRQSVVKEHLVKIDNKKYWLNTKLMPLELEGELKEILCIAREVTREKAISEQLNQAEKLASLGTFAAGLAHEINNPLGVIIGFGELLLENTSRDTQTHQDLRLIVKHALHCKRTVENLLSFTRSVQDGGAITDVNEAIKEFSSIIQHTLKVNNIDLKQIMAKNLPLVQVDKRELQQVFLNLITNTIDAMPKGGELTIITEVADNQTLKIIFQDNGCGIKKEHLDKIFDPFFTTKAQGRGTGLGLSISYSIITKYKGHIICESEENKGTTFIINLPSARGYYAG
jgi:PAS domain S-box-containing protein